MILFVQDAALGRTDFRLSVNQSRPDRTDRALPSAGQLQQLTSLVVSAVEAKGVYVSLTVEPADILGSGFLARAGRISMANDVAPQDHISGLDVAAKIAGLALLFTYLSACLFFAGWVYRFSFFNVFNIGVEALDLPAYGYTVYGILAFHEIEIKLWLLPMVVGDGLVVWYLIPMSMKRGMSFLKNLRWKPLRLRALAALLWVLPVYALVFGSHEGKADARKAWTYCPHVHLTFKAVDRQPYETALLEANQEHRLLLLTETKDLVLVFGAEPLRASEHHVFILARGDLASVDIAYP